MARLLRELEDEAWVEYGGFYLVDLSSEPLLKEDDPGAAGSGSHDGQVGGVEFRCSSDDINPRVRMQAWDGEPPLAPGEWEEVRTMTFTARTGRVQLAGVTAGPSGREFLIGPPHFVYGLRVHRTGAAEAARRRAEWNGENDLPRGVVRYLLQFWPLRDVFDPVRHGGRYIDPYERYGRRARPAGDAAGTRPYEGPGTDAVTENPAAARLAVPVPATPSAPQDWPVLWALPEPEEEAEEPADGTETAATRAHAWFGWGRPGDAAGTTGWVAREPGLLDLEPDLVLPGSARPADAGSWPEWRLEKARTAARIARELNPHGAPTHVLDRRDLRRSNGLEPGLSYRGWWWESTDPADRTRRRLDAAHREVVTVDVLGRRQLVTGIVTVLRVEDDQVQVRAAAPVEAHRVLRAEQAWAGRG